MAEDEMVKKEKKVVRKRRSKKEKESPLVRAIRLSVETGKVEFGSNAGLKRALKKKAKVFVLAENTPKTIMEKILHFSKLSEIPVIIFPGNTMELGSICGRPHPVALLSIYDVGTSDILSLVEK